MPGMNRIKRKEVMGMLAAWPKVPVSESLACQYVREHGNQVTYRRRALFEHSSVSANLYKVSLSAFPLRLSPHSFPDAMRPCPGSLGTTSSIPISCGPSGACVYH